MSADLDARVRLALYRDFADTGRAPSADRLAGILDAPAADVRASWERLAAGRAIVLQPESRELMFAPPLSAIPTPYLVRAGGRSYFAPCAWDAFGAAAMLGVDANIDSSCPCCGEGMTVAIRAGAPARARGIVHFAVPARRWWADLVFT